MRVTHRCAAAEGSAGEGGFFSTHNEGGRCLHTRSYTRSPRELPCAAAVLARSLARVEAELDGHSHVVRASRVTRARARVTIVTALVSATPIEVRSFHRRLVFSSLFSLVFSFFVSPRAHYDETTGDM